MGLCNCQSAVKKVETISAYASLQTLHFLAVTETRITPENTATPAALSTPPSSKHLSCHPAIPHHPDELPHFRPYSSSFQDSYSEATLDEADIQNYRHVSPLLLLSKIPMNARSTTICLPIFHRMASLTLINQALGLLTPVRQPYSLWLSHWVLPEPLHTRQSSFILTYLLRLIQSTTKYSSPLWLNLALLTLL